MNRDEIIRMAREAGLSNDFGNLGYPYLPELERFANLVAAAEREECAKLLDDLAWHDKLSDYYKVAALAIRERGAP